MGITIPAVSSSDGTRRILWWDEADLPADPEHITVADVLAAKDLSFHLVSGADGFNLSRPQDQIPHNVQGSSQNFSLPGRENPTLSVRWSFVKGTDPDDNLALLTLTRNKRGAFAEILDVPEDYEPDIDGDYEGYPYTYVPSRLGIPETMRQEANAVNRKNQPVSISGRIVDGVIESSS